MWPKLEICGRGQHIWATDKRQVIEWRMLLEIHESPQLVKAHRSTQIYLGSPWSWEAEPGISSLGSEK